MNYELLQQAATDVLNLLAADAPADTIQNALETYRIARIAYSADPSGSTDTSATTKAVSGGRLAKLFKMLGSSSARLQKLAGIMERNPVLRSRIHHAFLEWFTSSDEFVRLVNASQNLAARIRWSWGWPKYGQRMTAAAALAAKGGEGAAEARLFLRQDEIVANIEEQIIISGREANDPYVDNALAELLDALHSNNNYEVQEVINHFPDRLGFDLAQEVRKLDLDGAKLDQFVPGALDELVDVSRTTPAGEAKLTEFIFEQKDLINGSDKAGLFMATYFGQGTVGGKAVTAGLVAGAALAAEQATRDLVQPAIMDCLDLNDDPVAFDACVKSKIQFQKAKDAKSRFMKPILLGAVGVGTYLAIDNWPTIKRSFK